MAEVATAPANAAPDQTPEPASPSVLGTEKAAEAASPATLINEPVKTETKPGEAPPKAGTVSTEFKDFTMPKGATIDAALMGEFKEMAKTSGLTQEAAQKFVDLYAKAHLGAEGAAAKEFETTNSKWIADVKADKEIGGPNFDSMRVTVGKGLDAIFPNDPAGARAFREALDFTGAGNNPAVVRGIYRMAKAIAESGHVSGAPATGQRPSLAQAMWPNLNQGT